MKKIRLNDELEFPINGYSRYQYMDEGSVPVANFSFSNVEDSEKLAAFRGKDITKIEVLSDDKVIYSLTDIKARLTDIGEDVMDDGVAISASLRFDQN